MYVPISATLPPGILRVGICKNLLPLGWAFVSLFTQQPQVSM